ncbi:PEP-CTERM sorting domain-containing protein [Lacipirellula sp.]|uniref:PEP-CTERM sorting domain-containing protein n=1 Tax=Lacipirellula sp. TaxID=2691419 RepID=UPI003D0F97F0
MQAQYAPANPNGTAKAGSAVGFMTSTYGIYSFSAKIQPTATVPDYNLGAGYNTTIRWQLSIDRIGEWLDLNTVTVTPLGGTPVGLASGIEYVTKIYDDATSTWLTPTVFTTSTGTGSFHDLGLFAGVAAGYGEGPDYTKGYLFEWTLPGNVASYTLNATALGTSTSFKGTQVDTIARAAVPEPATLALAACGGVACLAARRRRK